LKIGLLLGALLLATPLPAQQITFTFDNPKLQPARYVLTVHADGSGHYRSELGPGTPPATDEENANPPADPQDRDIHVSRELRDSMFAAAHKSKLFAGSCDDAGKNVAFQGTKTLAYEGPDGQGSCTFNWSKNPQIDKLVDEVQAMVLTLDEGSKLQRQYEHGRLSLDTEIQFLVQMVHEGRATELENIAPLLHTLASDDAVLKRVQRHAQELLAAAKND
jgi:hypothetical protein